uniref:Uncharacterized protein n=1 Tax=Tetranychus urticae TaxID=32264 RepID=T1KS47_TETUR
MLFEIYGNVCIDRLNGFMLI